MTSARGGDAPVAAARPARFGGRPGPLPEAGRHLASRLVHADGPDERDDGRVGTHVPPVETDHVAAGQPGHGLPRPLHRPGVGMRRKDQAPQGASRDTLRALLRALDGGLDLPDLAGQLRGGKAGVSSTSDRRSRPSDRSFRRTSTATTSPSRSAPASRRPPTNSMAASISAPVRLAVPRVRSAAVEIGEPLPIGRGRRRPRRPGRTRGRPRWAHRDARPPAGRCHSAGPRGGPAAAGSPGSGGQDERGQQPRRARQPAGRPGAPTREAGGQSALGGTPSAPGEEDADVLPVAGEVDRGPPARGPPR